MSRLVPNPDQTPGAPALVPEEFATPQVFDTTSSVTGAGLFIAPFAILACSIFLYPFTFLILELAFRVLRALLLHGDSLALLAVEWLLLLAASAAIGVITLRTDQRLAETVPPYRWTRHAVRLITFAMLFAMAMNADLRFRPGESFYHASFRDIPLIPSHLKDFALAAIPAVFLHFLLVHKPFIRHDWHAILEYVRLRPRDLPDCRPPTAIIPAQPPSAGMQAEFQQLLAARRHPPS